VDIILINNIGRLDLMKILLAEVSFMNTIEKRAFVMSNLHHYRPLCLIAYEFQAARRRANRENPMTESDVDKILSNVNWDDVYARFCKAFIREGKLVDPEDRALDYLLDEDYYDKSLSKEEKIDVIRKKLQEYISDPVENSDRLVRFQAGTCLSRANSIKEANRRGFVSLERPVGQGDWSPVDRKYGLQINVRELCEVRSGIDRLDYYAERQALMNCSIPVVITGLIPAKCVYNGRNLGEYAISVRDFDKMIDVEILSPAEYSHKYLEEVK
jgi:hypothetical protein